MLSFSKISLFWFLFLLFPCFYLNAQSSLDESTSEEGFFEYFPVENFHTVETGKLYRSAQLTPESLARKIDNFGIKSIINLSVVNPDAEVYRDELALAKSKGVKYFSAGFSPSRIPTRKELLWLLNAYRTAPRPILVHCYAGADRTGLATAIYAIEFLKNTVSQALENLSFKYFHIKYNFPAMQYFIREIFRNGEWAERNYDPCKQNYQYFDSRLCR